jgi:hypothetical protein
MRRRVLFGALLAAVVAVLALSGTAVAGQPIAGCTASYTLIKAKVDPAVDKNGDGWICTKQISGPAGETVFQDHDNNANQ